MLTNLAIDIIITLVMLSETKTQTHQGYSPIVQPVEHLTVNQGVVGSSPTREPPGRLVKRLRHRPFTAIGVRFPHRSPFGRLAQLGERLPLQAECQRFGSR